MRTIEVTDEQYDFLIKLSKRLKEQDNRITADPIFCVYQKEIVYKPDGCGDYTAWFHPEGNRIEAHELSESEEIKEYREENPEDNDLSDREIIEDKLEYRELDYSIEEVPVSGQYYFTEEGAQQHIDANSYHYHEPFIYVESAWRNKEWQVIREILLNLESSSVLRADASEKSV